MDAIRKELEKRKDEIKKELRLLFNANDHITGWDVPEADQKEAEKILLDIMQEALDEIRAEILNEEV